LTGGIRKGAKGEPPVAISEHYASSFAHCAAPPRSFRASNAADSLIFFFPCTDFLAYDTIPEEIYLSG
jgi:hypothetical protein